MSADVARPTLSDEMRAVVDNLVSRKWIQGRMQSGDAVCAHGAVQTCRGLRPGDEHIIRAVMRARGVTEKWNDEPGRTKQEVLAALQAVKVEDADLAATFGPSWRMVVAVVRRAAALTPDEAVQLDAAWGAAWVAARDAWYAAWDAARDARAARDTARDVAIPRRTDAARDAARDAALACVGADLIGQQHGYAQEHHDRLMQPWIAVLGADWADGMLDDITGGA